MFQQARSWFYAEENSVEDHYQHQFFLIVLLSPKNWHLSKQRCSCPPHCPGCSTPQGTAWPVWRDWTEPRKKPSSFQMHRRSAEQSDSITYQRNVKRGRVFNSLEASLFVPISKQHFSVVETFSYELHSCSHGFINQYITQICGHLWSSSFKISNLAYWSSFVALVMRSKFPPRKTTHSYLWMVSFISHHVEGTLLLVGDVSLLIIRSTGGNGCFGPQSLNNQRNKSL